MTPGYTLHTGNEQPAETLNKRVIVRLFNSDRKTVFPANFINWKTHGPGAPSEFGRIFEYQVIQ